MGVRACMNVFVVDSASNRVLKMVNQLEYDRQSTLFLEGGGVGGVRVGVGGGGGSDYNGNKTTTKRTRKRGLVNHGGYVDAGTSLFRAGEI